MLMRPLLRLRSLITAHTAARHGAARHVARCAALGLTASALLAPSPLAAVAPLAMPQTAGTGKGASKAATKPKAKPKAKPAAKTKAATKAATKPATRKRSSAPTRRTTKAVPVLRHTTPRGEIALAADLHALLTARTTSGAWGVLVSSLSHGDTLFAFRGDAPMLPASTLKLDKSGCINGDKVVEPGLPA